MADPPYVVTESMRQMDGRLMVTFSLAPAVRYTTVVIPGADSAKAIRDTGMALATLYESQGYL